MRATHPRSSVRGGALILALLFMSMITVAFAVWAGLIQQRARSTELEKNQVLKRIAAANSEVMVRDYLLNRTMASDGDGDGLSSNSDGGNSWSTGAQSSWNGVSRSTTPVWSDYPFASISKLAGINGFSPTFDYPYSKSYLFTNSYRALGFVSESANYYNDATTYRGYARSRSPLLGGDLLVIHRPNLTATALPAVTGRVDVHGRVVHFTPEIAAASYQARSQRFSSPSPVSGGLPPSINVAPLNLAGTALMWSNLAWTPLTSGNVTTSNNRESGNDWRYPDYAGRLNFIDPGNSAAAGYANASNALFGILAATGSTIQRPSPPGPGVPADGWLDDSRGLFFSGLASAKIATFKPCQGTTTSDIPSVVIRNNIKEIIVDGQLSTSSLFTGYAQYRPATALVYSEDASTTTPLDTIRLRHQNRRRMILAIKKFTVGTVNLIVENSTPTAEWNLLILAENVNLNITYASTGGYATSTFNLVGGIQTNANLMFPSASPNLCRIELQTDSRGLIKLSPRLGWVETYLTGKL